MRLYRLSGSTNKMRLGGRLIIGSMFPFMGNEADVVKGDTPTEKKVETFSTETGWERVKRVLKTDEFGGFSQEVETVLQVSCMSMFVGALYGGVVQSRGAYMEFFKNNQATVFKDHIEAKKRLQDKVTVAFGRGAFRWGWRLTFFTTTYVSIMTGLSVYRNKNGILEHVAAGMVTGATYKFNMGPRGWIVGGGLGLLLGLVAGGTTLGLLKLSGMSMEETRYWSSQWRNKRAVGYDKALKEHLEKEELELLRDHNRKIENSVLGLETISSGSS